MDRQEMTRQEITISIDADGCPNEEVYRTARRRLRATVVLNKRICIH
jgi:uncharacterized protein YaiI (UPF0178 family)